MIVGVAIVVALGAIVATVSVVVAAAIAMSFKRGC